MAYVTAIVMLALIEYLAFGALAGRQRGIRGVSAPDTTGDEIFERYFRAHQNTLEQIVVFVPAMYACAYYVSDILAVIAGVVYLISRAIYFRSYTQEPAKRGLGMIGTMLANLVLALAGLIGALINF